jgi:L-ascorbate metabolism protein UlaG (beta-lactamase superfamily)
MDIKYLGHSSFLIKGKKANIVTDPYDSNDIGMKFPKHIAADIVTVTHDHPDHNAISEVEGNPFIVKGQGEYEIKGVGIIGLSEFHDNEKGTIRGINVIYRIEIDNIVIVHLGDLGHTLPEHDLDILDGVDILMIPVGGNYTIDPQIARTVIQEIEPSIVIPMHYSTPEHDPKFAQTLQPLSAFLREIGKEEVVPQPKLTISKDKIPEEMQVVVLG